MKKIISMALSAMLLLASLYTDSHVVFAAGESENSANVVATTDWKTVKTKVDSDATVTAQYINSELKKSLEEGNALTYNILNQEILCIRAGAGDEEVIRLLNEKLTEFLNSYRSDGVKSLGYAVAVLYLNATGQNPENYEGVNLVEELYEIFMEEQSVNPYAYQYVNMAFQKSSLENEKLQNVNAKIKEGVLGYYVDSEENGTGIDYWGVSADNNANVLSAVSGMYFDGDTEIREKVDKALAWTLAQCDETGAIVSWGSANPDSTGLALRMFAEYQDLENAYKLYLATEQFKGTEGAYTYYGSDNFYATVDMMWGLVFYQDALKTAIEDFEKENTEDVVQEIQKEENDKNDNKVNENIEIASKNQQNTQTESVNTGDETVVMPFVMIGFVAVSVLILMRNRRNEEIF